MTLHAVTGASFLLQSNSELGHRYSNYNIRYPPTALAMGNKTFFEFLEEEFQVLTSQLQQNLSQLAADERYDNPDAPEALGKASQQLARCQAVLQQLKIEGRKDSDHKDRVELYKIQLEALRLEHQRHGG